MIQNEIETLAALEQLMSEFFTSSTSNERKHAIEQQLNSFSFQKDSWKMCIYFVKHTSSQYVSMYALSTIESVIKRQWNCLDPNDRVFLKNSLSSFIFEQDNSTPNFIRNKLAKLLVDIGQYEWPQFYPEFYNSILQLLQSENGQLLGLILLRTTSEELTSCCSLEASNQKQAMTAITDQHIPQVFQLLNSILEGLSNKRRRNATVTPPPSPTHPSQAPNLAEQISAASFRPDSKEITREVLSTLQHLFTWVNLSQVPVEIVNTILNFTNVSSYAQEDDDMCVLAMSTLNELLYRKCVPPGAQDLFVQLYFQTVHLLRDITNLANGKIDTLGPDFVEKLTELLALYIEQHMWRLESRPDFSAIDFLEHLFQMTMHVPSTHCYMRCLSVWIAFIKHVKAKKPPNAHKYSEALQGLVVAVLSKMQFVNNLSQLDEISNDELNENNETELQCFLNTSIELIAMVGELSPLDTFSKVLDPWKTANDFYLMLRNINVSNGSLKLDYAEGQRLHCFLRDLASLTQTLARLSSIFMDQETEHHAQATGAIENLLTKLMESASLSTAVAFYNLKMHNAKLVEDFLEVHCQILSALKTWWLWLNSRTDFRKDSKDLNQIMQVVLPLLQSAHGVPAKVALSAAQLLLTITSSVHPSNFILMPDLMNFLHVAPNLKYPKNQSREVVMCALATFLIKPWGDLNQSDSQARNNLIANLFDSLSRDYRQISENYDHRRVKEVTTDCLPCLCNIVDYSKDFPLQSKKLLYFAVRSSVEHTLNILPSFAKYPDLNELLLQFLLKVLEVLQQQMGVAAVNQCVDVYVYVTVREQQSKQFYGLDKLLKILQLIVEAPGSSYKNFLQGIFELCMENIYPSLITQANEHPDAIIALINLLHSILLHRWNYFYISQIRLGNSPGCSDVEPSADSPQQQEQLLEVLKVFGQSLLQPDINTFRASLSALENLNNKWKLYHKALFRDHLLSQFLSVLLQTLLDKSHNLLNDDIMIAFYNMASVSLPGFFANFLPHFLDGLEHLTAAQKDTLKRSFTQESDMPTFIQHLQRFVNDARSFIMCNNILPPGSVVL